MKMITCKNQRPLKLVVLTAGTVALGPFLNPVLVQAKPPSHAPAWGYRDKGDKEDRKRDKEERKHERKNGRDDRRDNRDDDDDDDHDYRDRNGDWRRDRNGNQNNGGYNGYPGGHGYPGGYNGNYPGGNVPRNQNVNFQGTVLRVSSVYRLDMRGDNGQVYVVTSGDNFSTKIHTGDRVRVSGVVSGGNSIRAKTVKLVDDRSNGGWNNSAVNFGGRVESVRAERGAQILKVRGDNGQLYTVRYSNNARFRSGERVRVIGNYTNGYVNASSVSR